MAFGTDYTPVGPMPTDIVLGDVDATSMRLARDIRDKGHGIDTRETMARMILKSSTMHNHLIKVNNALKVQNDEYYRQFTDAMKELSKDKDYYSLPEIAGARRGYDTLAESLQNLSPIMLNPNLGKLTQVHMSDELLAQIAGNAPINAVPADGTITTQRIAEKAITTDKTDFISGPTNLFDKSKITPNKNIIEINGDLLDIAGYNVSDFIPVSSGKHYWLGTVRKIATFDKNKSVRFNQGYDVSPRAPFDFVADFDGFIRFSLHNEDLDSFVASVGDKRLSLSDLTYQLAPKIVVKNTSLMSDDGIVAIKSGDLFKIKYKYNDTINEMVEFSPLGINNIIHPKKISRETANELTTALDGLTTHYVIDTDWVSPYKGIIADNGTTSFTGTVGGNHGTAGAGGFATARPVSANFYVDGKLVTDNQVVYGDIAKLIVTNYVSASNRINTTAGTKADSLLETVVYTVTKNNIEVAVTLKAEEPLTINGYVGLQMTPQLVSNADIYFGDKATKYKADGALHNSDGLPFDGDRVVISNESDLVAMHTNRSVGVGNLSKIGTSPIHFVSEFNKVYSHLIGAGQSLRLLPNQVTYYSGGYSFMSPLKCNGAEKAYKIKLNGQDVYCVDFFSVSYGTYLETSIADYGKEIEIIEKSDTVTADEVISGNGLRLSSTGFGTLKFKIKN